MSTPGRYEALIRSKTGTLPETMTTAELASAMGVSANTMKNWRKAGLPYVGLGRKGKGKFFYRTAAVIEWATKYQPLPPEHSRTRPIPCAEWGWQRDGKVNCVGDKTLDSYTKSV
jgi:hypothetical protein